MFDGVIQTILVLIGCRLGIQNKVRQIIKLNLNKAAMAPPRLILGQHGATGYKNVLNALPIGFHMIVHRFLYTKPICSRLFLYWFGSRFTFSRLGHDV